MYKRQAPPVALADTYAHAPGYDVPGANGGFFDSPLDVAETPEIPAYADEGGLKVGPAGLAVAAQDEEDDSVFDTQEDAERFDSMQFGGLVTLSGSKVGSRVGSRVASRAPSGGLVEASGGLVLGRELEGTGVLDPTDDSVTATMW